MLFQVRIPSAGMDSPDSYDTVLYAGAAGSVSCC
jgi:hypothetical protein